MNGNRFLLDTNTIITLQRDDNNLKALLTQASEIFIPVIAVGELYFGAYKSQKVEENRKAVALFIAHRVVLNVDGITGDIYGQIKQLLQQKGRPIPENDIWIAALSIQYHLTLVTKDGHFKEISPLNTLAW